MSDDSQVTAMSFTTDAGIQPYQAATDTLHDTVAFYAGSDADNDTDSSREHSSDFDSSFEDQDGHKMHIDPYQKGDTACVDPSFLLSMLRAIGHNIDAVETVMKDKTSLRYLTDDAKASVEVDEVLEKIETFVQKLAAARYTKKDRRSESARVGT